MCRACDGHFVTGGTTSQEVSVSYIINKSLIVNFRVYQTVTNQLTRNTNVSLLEAKHCNSHKFCNL